MKDKAPDKRTNGIVHAVILRLHGQHPNSQNKNPTKKEKDVTSIPFLESCFSLFSTFIFSLISFNHFTLSSWEKNLPGCSSPTRQPDLIGTESRHGINETDSSLWGRQPRHGKRFRVLLSHSISSPWPSPWCHFPTLALDIDRQYNGALCLDT